VTVASELRDLVREIERALEKSSVNSVAYPAVHLCCDHLSAIARISEMTMEQREQFKKEKKERRLSK
jgi:hypothetical protein